MPITSQIENVGKIPDFEFIVLFYKLVGVEDIGLGRHFARTRGALALLNNYPSNAVALLSKHFDCGCFFRSGHLRR